MMRSHAIALVSLALALTGCGSSIDDSKEPSSPVPGGADPASVAVIDDWSTALRDGDVDGAAGFFAIPSQAQNGPIAVEITDRADAVRFNESLPCGAVLERASDHAGLVIATFRLTERPGPGRCGTGTGELAGTAFRIVDGEILEWLRVPVPGAEDEEAEPPSDVV